MTHVELSLTESSLFPHGADAVEADHPLRRWAMAVSLAMEPCVLLNTDAVVIAASPACRPFFAVDPADAIGKRLVEGVLRLIDFTATPEDLPEWEVDKIPPLLALSAGSLARGLLRVPGSDGYTYTLDAVPPRSGTSPVWSAR